MVKCSLCEARPREIGGHEMLSLVEDKALFECSSCGATWRRTYEGAGQFAWIETDPVGGP